MRRRSQSGVSLLELVVVIVIVGVVGAGMAVLINNTTRNSVNPLLVQQANAIARAYMEEVTLRPFCDPDFDPDADPSTLTICSTDCSVAACGTCGGVGVPPSGSRDQFDDICDYDGLSNGAGAVDQTGALIPGLEAFNVTVNVDDTVILNGLDGASGQVVQIDVNVSHDTNPAVNVDLTSFRANF